MDKKENDKIQVQYIADLTEEGHAHRDRLKDLNAAMEAIEARESIIHAELNDLQQQRKALSQDLNDAHADLRACEEKRQRAMVALNGGALYIDSCAAYTAGKLQVEGASESRIR